jgi:hypothetical protein
VLRVDESMKACISAQIREALPGGCGPWEHAGIADQLDKPVDAAAALCSLLDKAGDARYAPTYSRFAPGARGGTRSGSQNSVCR